MNAICFVVIMIILIIFLLTLLYIKNTCNKKVTVLQKTINILSNHLQLESNKKVEFHNRVLELEDGIKNGVGITLRNEITQIKTEFNPIELNDMSMGLYELIKTPHSPLSAIKDYIILIDKLNTYIKLIVDNEKDANKE